MKKRFFKRSIVSLALATLLMSLLFLNACSFLFTPSGNITLKVNTLNLSVGQSITIDKAYYSLKTSSSNNQIVLTSGDEAILTISDETVTAVSAGETYLTLSAKANLDINASMVVKVSEVEPTELKIIHSGEIFQDAGFNSNVLFMADFGLISAPHKSIDWTVKSDNTELDSQTIAAKESFSFMPQSHGRYTISATTVSVNGVLNDSIDVNVYKPYIIEPSLNIGGTLTQEEGEYSTVEFSVSYTDNPDNPDRVVSWLVNDNLYGSDKSFFFKPQNAGIYEISLYVSGKFIESVTLIAKGSIVPKNLRLDFDNSYPNVYLEWDSFVAGLGYQVIILDEQNRNVNAIDISTQHGTTGALFSGTKVNLTSIIGTNASKNIFTNSLKFQVKSLGGGDFKESEYSDTLISERVPQAAQSYLEKKYYDSNKNYYISSKDEFIDIMAYFYMWRENPILSSGYDKSENTLYIAFPVVNVTSLISEANSSLHLTGRTDTQFSEIINNIMQINIEFQTDSLPSKTTQSIKSDSNFMGGIGSVRPHVDYNKNNKRGALPIDNVARTVEVTNTEQLYHVAQLGYRPIPKNGSDAQKAYNYAREVLLQIINDGMNNVEKAHAIYDWIMWQVNYDHSVLTITSLDESVRYTSYYLEGVFNDDYNYAVCDALAKAYALMCNMENIPCIRVAGEAGEPAPEGADEEAWRKANWGGHAWNKVNIDGNWYIVDLTWGDETIVFKPNTTSLSKYYEFAFHRYFLLTDKDVQTTRREDEPNNYPRTATMPYNFYADTFVYDGQSYDSFFNSDELTAKADAERYVGYITTAITNGKRETADPLFDPMFSKRNEAEQYFPGSPKNQRSSNNFAAFDVKISMNLKNIFSPQVTNNAFSQAFAKAGYKSSDYQLYELSSFGYYYIFIIVSI